MDASVGFRRSYDAILVGARCAGAATAMLLARQGLRVLAIEQARYGSDTLSTLALMRGGVLALDRWGVLASIEKMGTPAVRRTSFHYGDEVIDIQIKPRNGIGALYAPRRKYLDRLLVDAARESGAQIEHGVRMLDLTRSSDGRVTGVVVRTPDGDTVSPSAEIVIGADGSRSSVARLVGAQPYRVAKNSGAVVYGLFEGLEESAFHWHYRPGVGAGFIPTNDGLTLFFVSATEERFRNEIGSDLEAGFRRLVFECAPEIAEPLLAARRVGPFHGFPGKIGYLRQSFGRGWALVGDAGYFKDPITAHGITDALRDAELLSRAVAPGTESALAAYQETRDALSLGLFDITDEIAGYGWTLEGLKKMHLRMSDAMNREVAHLAHLYEERALRTA
jgi:2-polyprenyl-6-methoxyphenol hydroxylase-like FAD-dependent oxidoreductase